MILSIDIGLRNLAFCCMSTTDKKDISTYNIHLWEVYNTLDSDDYKCKGVQKSGKICNKKCGYKFEVEGNPEHSCKIHFPKNIVCTKKNIFKKKNIDKYLLQDIANIVLLKLQSIYDEFLSELNITQIIIELQPKINQKMKFTSHIIYGKLVDIYREQGTTIKFVRASQKLKAYTGPYIECKLKGKYAQRKWLSIQYCKWFLENKFTIEQKEKWLVFFDKHSKQDDAADTFLMAINCLFGIPKKQTVQKNGECIK
jgi:hypothetical protein